MNDGVQATDWMASVRLTAEVSYFSLLHSFQTGTGVHPTSYPMVPRVISIRIKRSGREAYHLLQSSAEVRNGGAVPPFSYKSSWRDM
jgi:hypothetical protein